MRAALVFLGAVFLLAAGTFWWLKFEHHPPQVSLPAAVEVLGRKTPFDVDIRTDAPGLRAVTVRLQAGGVNFELLSETHPAVNWRGSGLAERRVRVETDLLPLKVPEGPATLEVYVETHAWHILPPSRAPRLSRPVTIRLTPPKLELLTTQHNIRLGGMDVAVFRQSPETVRSGIEVDKYFFPAVTGYFADPTIALAFFAIPQDLTADARPRLIARDAAGNQREVYLPCNIKPRHFAERTLAVDDDFLSRKVPEIEHDNGLPIAADLLQGYLYINGDLRRQNEARILELTATSVPEPLWDGAFRRQPNAAPLSSFADRRTYTYHGEVIDHQTHLGYDLASVKLSPVEAAQDGIVVYANNLGIYGNAVILDHGMGIFTLYGHLSSTAVQPGEHVKAGQTLGQTGETGLAGGDHLHFSVMLRGVHVDPVEWWDPHWLHDRVTTKLMMFPRATTGQPHPSMTMSKPDRQTQLRLGEQQLEEWGVPADAGVAALRQVSGRDSAADLAIAARLGAHPDPAGVEALTALEAASSDKLVRKEIKRSLYRLERRGVTIPHTAPTKPALMVPPPALEGCLSAVDGNGDQLVWLAKPRAGGLAHLFAVVNDPRGLREVDLSETTRKALRAARQELFERHEIRMIDVEWRYCDYLIDRGWRWATEQGQPVSGDYPRLRAQLTKQPVTEMQPLICTRLDAEAVRAQPQLVADSATLLEEKEFRTWFFDRDALKPYVDEILEAKSSPLVLAPVQQQERFRIVVERAIEELFGGEMRPSWVRRLQEIAYFLHETGRPEQAKRAVAAALALAASSRGGRDIGICEQLVRTSLSAFLQVEEEREAEESRTSLVLTPQQVAREAQQRRR